MMIPVNVAGEHGIVSDRPAYELPMNAWSMGRNVRFRDGFVEKFLGHSQVFGTPTVAPYFAVNVLSPAAAYWVYAGLAKVYVYDGSVHTDLTRAVGGDYAATADLNWTVGILGGIPVFNNGVDDPQMWLPVSTGQRLQLLTAWPANTKCRALRAFKQFLVAMDVTKSGTRYPQMVKWSHGAAPGAVPSSWDENDATKDAGEWELKDTGDFVLDCAPLRNLNIIYKENTTHLMQYVGGTAIFRFDKLFDTLGALSRRCVAEFTAGKHAVFGDGDIAIHDGQAAQSVVQGRLRSRIYNAIDPTYYGRSFLVHNKAAKEVWCCFAETGSAGFPSLAFVWNYQYNTTGFRDLPSASHIALGIVDPGATSDQWGAGPADTWDGGTGLWDQRGYNPTTQSILIVSPSDVKLYQAEQTSQFAGSNMAVSLERTHLAIPMRVGLPPDLSQHKQLRRLWPRIEGTQGGVVTVTVGAHEDINAAPVYSSPKSYTIGTTQFIDARVRGRLLALKFASSSAISWKLHGYELDVVKRGST